MGRNCLSAVVDRAGNLQALDPFLMAVGLLKEADHGAVEVFQGGKQRSGAVALLIVRHRTRPAAFDRQPGPGAIQRWDLALFVKAQHDGMLGRIEGDSDDISQLLGDPRIAAQVDRLDAIGLRTVRCPDASHGGRAYSAHRRHPPRRPVRKIGWSPLCGAAHDAGLASRRDRRGTSWTAHPPPARPPRR